MSLRSAAGVSLLAFALALASACSSTPLSVAAMVPHDVEVTRTISGSVGVRAHGSADSWYSSPAVSEESLQSTLVQALIEHEIFESVRSDGSSDWQLTVSVTKLLEPETGLDMTATIDMDWLLVRRGSGEIAWNATLRTSHTANNYDAPFIKERGVAALQGAVKKNVEKGLSKLAQLEL